MALAESEIQKLPEEDQRLLTASAHLTSITHCIFLLANHAIQKLNAKSINVQLGDEDRTKQIFHLSSNGQWPAKFINSLKIAFKQNKTIASVEKCLVEIWQSHFPVILYTFSMAEKVSIRVKPSVYERTKEIILKYSNGSLDSFEMITNGSVLSSDTTEMITISNIFYNFPVRSKFQQLRSQESLVCLSQLLTNLSVIHPVVQFTCQVGDKIILQSGGSFPNRLGAFCRLKSLLPSGDFSPIKVLKTEQKLAVDGFVCLKRLNEGDFHVPKLIFINKLPLERVSSIYDMFDGLLAKYYAGAGHQHNLTFSFMISFRIPTQQIEMEWIESGFHVEIKDSQSFQRFIEAAVKNFIENRQQGNSVEVEPNVKVDSVNRSNRIANYRRSFAHSSSRFVEDPPIESSGNLKCECSNFFQIEAEDEAVRFHEMPTKSLLPKYFPHANGQIYKLNHHQLVPRQDFKIEWGDVKKLQVVGQFGDTFIICRLNSTMVAIDQHAAHERIRLERFLRRKPKPIAIGNAPELKTIKFPNVHLKDHHRPAFNSVGWASFGIEFETTFENSAVVLAIPDVFFDIFDGNDDANKIP